METFDYSKSLAINKDGAQKVGRSPSVGQTVVLRIDCYVMDGALQEAFW